MVLRLFYHHILQQYVGIYSVLFSYRSPIVLLLFSYWGSGNNTESNGE